MNQTDFHTNLENRNTSNYLDDCTECTKNRRKVQLLEKNNENLRKKYKQLLRELSEFKKSQNPNSSFDDDTMAIENQLDDYDEWCEVCWKKLAADETQHICMDNIVGIRCEYCSKLLKSTIELRDHLCGTKQSNPKMYKCEQCSLEYPSALLLLFHQMSELDHAKSMDDDANKTIKCYICDANFNSKPDMELHFRNHLLVQKCEICNVKLNFRTLDEHLCDEQEIMQCEYCSKPFDATIKLIEHLNSQHTDGILHKCQKCPKFYKMDNLRVIHEKYHPEEKLKPFWCEQCLKGFATDYSLNCHKELHSNESMNESKNKNNTFVSNSKYICNTNTHTLFAFIHRELRL